MAKEATGAAPHSHQETGASTNKDEAKKAVNKYEAFGDASLDAKHLKRAATEYMIALRPQPTQLAMEMTLDKLVEKDDKGELKHKVKKAEEVPAIVDGLLAA